MTAMKVTFPAKLVGYRIDAAHDRIVLFEDGPTLFNDGELQRRRATYAALEAAGAIPYTFEAVSLEDLDAAMAEIRGLVVGNGEKPSGKVASLTIAMQALQGGHKGLGCQVFRISGVAHPAVEVAVDGCHVAAVEGSKGGWIAPRCFHQQGVVSCVFLSSSVL